jgi:hypothetical protein
MEGKSMCGFMRCFVDRPSGAMRELARIFYNPNTRDLAVFGLLPLPLHLASDQRFAHEVELGLRSAMGFGGARDRYAPLM